MTKDCPTSLETEEEPPPKRKKAELTCPEWMMTMRDAMSLLLCFFVLLLTISTMEEAKLMDVSGVLQGANAPADFESYKDTSRISIMPLRF